MKRKAILSLLLFSTISQTHTFALSALVARTLVTSTMGSISTLAFLDHRIQQKRSVESPQVPRRTPSIDELVYEAQLVQQEAKAQWNKWFPQVETTNTTDEAVEDGEDIDAGTILG